MSDWQVQCDCGWESEVFDEHYDAVEASVGHHLQNPNHDTEITDPKDND